MVFEGVTAIFDTITSKAKPRFSRMVRSRLYGAFLIAALCAVLAILRWASVVGNGEVAAMAIGGLVGIVELLGRYRQAPLRAAFTLNGIFYIAINMGASWAAFYLLEAFHVFGKVTVAKEVTQILTAGFGSLVFMRSSFFKVRVGDSDVGIGPAAILDTLLLVADRGVDRREAVARAQDVSELVAHVRDPRLVAKMLTKYSLALMQNVDEKTGRDVEAAVEKIMTDKETNDTIKMDIVALRLGLIVGSDVLEAAVAALGDRLTAATSSGQQTTLQATGSTMPLRDELKAELDKGKS